MSTKVFIPSIKVNNQNRKTLFILVRPFLTPAYKWKNDVDNFLKWGVDSKDFSLVEDIEKAQLVLLPLAINTYFESDNKRELLKINKKCKNLNIKAYGYIAGDFGQKYPTFSNICFLRMGGFKSQLDNMNKGFPVMIGDQHINEEIIPKYKKQIATIGFCGHASFSPQKRFKEILKCFLENSKRFLKNPLQKAYEPLFASAYERAKLLASFELSSKVKTNFIFRNHYRAGAITKQQRENTTLEYYNNIKNSDYILCVRGGGNFSVRLYETLMMGRIPIFVNTDCLLPFEDQIDWKQHVVWVEWKDRKNIADAVFRFHNNLSEQDFINLQFANRKLWKETLSVSNMLKMISYDF